MTTSQDDPCGVEASGGEHGRVSGMGHRVRPIEAYEPK